MNGEAKPYFQPRRVVRIGTFWVWISTECCTTYDQLTLEVDPAVGLPVTTGLSGGIPRFFVVIYPVYYALADATRNAPRARVAAWLVFGLLLLVCAARFVNWQWVA